MTVLISNSNEEQRLIVQVIADECEAFYLRDYNLWATYWLHDECVQRLGMLAGGQMIFQRGWAEESSKMIINMRDHPQANLSAASMVRRENMSVRIFGDMAWVTFDQITPRTSDIFINVGLSYQVRILEKHDGLWKITYAAHGDTSLDYYDSPTICVDGKGRIIWSNNAAKSKLPNHPVLVGNADYLRTFRSEDYKILLSAIEATNALTAMDIRLSTDPSDNNKSAIPIVFDDPNDNISHVIWITKVDGQILVCFDDQESEKRRLALATELYGLSNSQETLAALIVEGCNLATAAKRMDITINTARTHLQRIFDKTSVRNQTALVRVLLNIDAPRA